MTTSVGIVESVYLGLPGQSLVKEVRSSLKAELDGFFGDRHASVERSAWGAGDKQAKGVIRRNERQWSAVSMEELADISLRMNLTEGLTAGSIGANLCFKGIPNFSQLPKGSIFKFPSGAELMVEEYNPPCLAMGRQLAKTFRTRSGEAIHDTTFSKAAEHTRGLVGVVEVPGLINSGDTVTLSIYEQPILST